jgi:hypothetical protein
VPPMLDHAALQRQDADACHVTSRGRPGAAPRGCC